MRLFHRDGWTRALRAETDAEGSRFSAGECLLLVGGRFSGWEEELQEIALVSDRETLLALQPRREPGLTILTPPGEVRSIVIQAGEDSIEVEADATGSQRVTVPAGAPLILLAEGARTRWLALEPLTGDAVADLRPAACLLAPDLWQRVEGRPRGRLLLEAREPGGSTCAGELEVKGPGGPQVERLGPGSFRVEAPEGVQLLLRFKSPGHADAWSHAFMPRSGAVQPALVLTPTPLARLSIHAASGLEVEGPLKSSLSALHPGPLNLVLRLDDGRRLALSLELRPGESRELRVIEAE